MSQSWTAHHSFHVQQSFIKHFYQLSHFGRRCVLEQWGTSLLRYACATPSDAVPMRTAVATEAAGVTEPRGGGSAPARLASPAPPAPCLLGRVLWCDAAQLAVAYQQCSSASASASAPSEEGLGWKGGRTPWGQLDGNWACRVDGHFSCGWRCWQHINGFEGREGGGRDMSCAVLKVRSVCDAQVQQIFNNTAVCCPTKALNTTGGCCKSGAHTAFVCEASAQWRWNTYKPSELVHHMFVFLV